MSAPNEAISPSGSAPSAPVDRPPIPLPPPTKPLPPSESNRAALEGFDSVLMVLVLVLGAMVSIFAVRNSDFWLHLAVGRGIVSGEFGPGSEPFSFVSDGTWVNHSWLYGLLLYGGWQTVGPSVLVVLKALIVAALAATLLRLRPQGSGLWIASLGTALALVAMTPRLLLQPTLISFVLVAVTYALLTRGERSKAPENSPQKKPGTKPPPWLGEPEDRILWVLPPLFALWANLDAWYFLGPLLVAMALLGELLGGKGSARQGSWRPLAALLGAGVLACLVTPFHVHGLTLPGEILSASLPALERDEIFKRMLQSPWASSFLEREAVGSLASFAYFPLVFLSALSFLLNIPGFRWTRLLTWIALFALSVLHARAIAFFAVVAGPILTMNLQEAIQRTYPPQERIPLWLSQWSILGRGLSVLALFGLIALAWPGWLTGRGSEARRVAISAEPDPSLVKAAELLTKLRAEGLLTGNLLNISPDVGHILAWLTPVGQREKTFLDYRFGLFGPEATEDYVKLRRAFSVQGVVSATEGGLGSGEVDRLLSKYKISHVVFYDPDLGRADLVMQRLVQDSARWLPLHLDGRTSVFGLAPRTAAPAESNPFVDFLRARTRADNLPPPAQKASSPLVHRTYDAAEAAFGAAAEPLPKDAPPPSPERAWWEPYARGSGTRPPASDEARMLLHYFDAQRYEWHYQNVLLPWGSSLGASMVGTWAMAPAPYGSPAMAAAILRLRLQAEPPPLGGSLEGPTAPAILAVRRSRETVYSNPYISRNYMWMGQAYRYLTGETAERTWEIRGIRFPGPAQTPPWVLMLPQTLRRIQTIVALRHALQLDKDMEPAHAALSESFQRIQFYDLALKHVGERLRIMKQVGPLGGLEELKDFNERLETMDKQYREFQKQLGNQENEFAVRASGKKPLEKAIIALDLGLAEKSLQTLLDSDSIEFGAEGSRLQLELLLSMGDFERLKIMLLVGEKEQSDLSGSLRKAFGAPLYELYRYLMAAGEGDYATADRFLDQAAQFSAEATEGDLSELRRAVFAPTALREMAFGGSSSPLPDVPGIDNLDGRALMAAALVQSILEGVRAPGPIPWQLKWRDGRQMGYALIDSGRLLRPLAEQSDFATLRGLLAVESGDIPTARQHFRKALFLDTKEIEPVVGFTLLRAAQHYLDLIEKQQQKAVAQPQGGR